MLLRDMIGISHAQAEDLVPRLRSKLERGPVEDLRIDFEDGYGVRSDQEEDDDAARVGAALGAMARASPAAGGSPYLGIRIKSLRASADRSLRTLDACVTSIVRAADGVLPAGFVVTLPKAESVEEVRVLDDAITDLESRLGLPARTIPVEIMVESPRALIATSDGGRARLVVGELVLAAGGRCRGVHFGVYDYLSSLGVAAIDQRMDHPACDFARHLMLACLGDDGTWLSDGVTNVLPVPVHRGSALSASQIEENLRSVQTAWRIHAADVRRQLGNGIFQGWDVHPAQLVSRHAAVYAYYRAAMLTSTARLRQFIDTLAKATRVGNVFDDAATGRGLLAFFARGWDCGALTDHDCANAGLERSDLERPSWDRLVGRVCSRVGGSGTRPRE